MGSQPRSSGANALPPVYPNFALPCHATIRSLLDLPRVNIRIEEVTTGGTGWHEDLIEVREEDIEPWDDFNEENIDSMFGDLLDGEITWDTGHATSVGAHAHDEFRIVYERDIDMMFEKNRGTGCSEMLEFDCRQIPTAGECKIRDERGDGIRRCQC